MAQKKPGLMLYFEDFDSLRSTLCADDLVSVLDAMVALSRTGTFSDEEKLSDAARICWRFMKPRIERDSQQYAERVKKRRDAANARWNAQASMYATTAEESQLIINKVRQSLVDSDKASQERQKAAEDAVGGDYMVFLANFLIQNADVLAMLQDAGYKIEVTGKASACIQSGPIKYMMTTSDLVERISRFNKTMEGLVSSFPEMKKEADDDAPQANP